MMKTRKPRARSRFIAALGACALVLALVACSSGEHEVPDDAVLIAQGTDPRIEGLSIGLASVSGDEARMSITPPDHQNELIKATAGETVEVGGYTIEIFEVESNDEGGSVRLKVTAPEADL